MTIENIEFIRYNNYDGGIDTTIFNSTYPWKGDQIVEIKYDIRTNLGRKYSNDYITANSSGNKGFIYWMKDMNGNEADFEDSLRKIYGENIAFAQVHGKFLPMWRDKA